MSGKVIEDGQDRLLVLAEDPEKTDRTEIRMLGDYAPEGLLRMRFRRSPECLSVLYTVSGLQTLSEAMREESQEALLYAVISALSGIGPVLREHFLSLQQLSLQPEEIYLNSEQKVRFLYRLVPERSFQQSLQSLMEYFLRQMNPQEEEEVLLLYGLYQKSREEQAAADTLLRYYEGHRKKQKEASGASMSEEAPAFEERGIPDASGLTPEGRTAEAESFPLQNLPPFSDGLSQESPFSEKLWKFVKKHRYDLLIALIVVIGVILFILI